jgi:hypothetical protein
MEIDDLLNRYFEGKTTVAEEKALREFFRSDEVPERLAENKALFAYFDEEIRKTQSTGNVQSGRSRRLFYWAAAACILVMLGIWQAFEGFARKDNCMASSGYVIINGRCYADVEKARAMALEALMQVATPAEDFFPDTNFFNDN